MMIFNSFALANDYNFGAQWPNGRGGMYVSMVCKYVCKYGVCMYGRSFLPTNKTFEGICLALAGKFLQKLSSVNSFCI